MLAHATRSDPHVPPSAPADGALAVSFLRYLDVVLVIAATPIVLLANLPTLGFAVGAAGWIVVRFAVEIVKARAWRARDTRSRAALHLTALLGRVWLIALVVLGAHFLGHNSDGIVAAVVVLAAFTVELIISMVFREEIIAGTRGPS
jgi:hypothetical protein